MTLEISNTTPLPAKIYANEGIAQVLFFQSDEPCEVSYADKKGKYLKQLEVTLPKAVAMGARFSVVSRSSAASPRSSASRALPANFNADAVGGTRQSLLPHAIAVIVNGGKAGYVAPEVARRIFEHGPGLGRHR